MSITRVGPAMLLIAGCTILAIRAAHAGDSGFYHNGIYLPPKLPEWGQEHPENRPWKYKPGEAVHELVNDQLQFFIVTVVEWDNISKQWKYKKVPDFRMKL